MKKYFIIIIAIMIGCTENFSQEQSTQKLIPISSRVNIQSEVAQPKDILLDEWVAVGVKRPYSIQIDETKLYKGQPSFRFELRENDNTLSDYKEGATKGRAEVSRCFATMADFQNKPEGTYENAQMSKTVYFHGKEIYPQGSSQHFKFAIWVSSTLSKNASTIFAQWHGMPDSHLATTPKGKIIKLSDAELAQLLSNMIFSKGVGYKKVLVLKEDGTPKLDKNGASRYEKGQPTGWKLEQGGYPPLAFGFAKGLFYIKANSDRKWFSEKEDRCNANPENVGIMQSVQSTYKRSTIAYKMPFVDFPKEQWVSFDVDVTWSRYGKESEKLLKSGKLNVEMHYNANGQKVNKTIVNNETIDIGRNDEMGYYFKFGIYRVGNSTIPVSYHLGGFSQD